ncbi:TetR/AcrR family transcriptional regulator [Deinococcus sp. KSM4-11]|uniref:TetR/AcrR family transcriptional regulator n=1 Tax=Deinococcus sp. KSM4-11 TaxID=2568654 RepID=UPI001454BFEB|nr:TetR/AcrR family transcriptional regulator [Deinococcus sp. KSM4-11]
MRASRASPRGETEQRLLDAAERLLIQVGYASITTRTLAEEAGVNHGLVHYYFGSMEELFLRVLERFTQRLTERQRAMYAAPIPFIEKWREAMRYLDEDRPYQKIWWELQALAWNRPEYQPRVLLVHTVWRDAMRTAVSQAVGCYRLDTGPFSAEDWITLIVTMNTGVIHQRLSGIDEGHTSLLAAIERWMTTLDERAAHHSVPEG